MESIQASVEYLAWEKPDSDWRKYVMRLTKEDGRLGLNFTAVGIIQQAKDEEILDLEGDWVDDPKYGRQFKVSASAKAIPTTPEQIYKYLVREVSGVGPRAAKRIVDYFGEGLRDVLNNEPARLAEVPRTSPTIISRITKAWQTDCALRQIKVFLAGHDMNSNTLADKCFAMWGIRTVEILTKNPYQATALDGIGFRKADEMAMKLGVARNAPERLEAAIAHHVDESRNDGHVFLHRGQVIEGVADLTGEEIKSSSGAAYRQPTPRDQVEEALQRAIERGDIVEDRQVVNGTVFPLEYLPRLYRAECNLAERVIELLEVPGRPSDGIFAMIAQAEHELGIRLSDKQRQAVFVALLNPLSIITGGPGTGKSTVVKVVLRCMEKMGWDVKMAAPTGRAAKRMTEVTDHPASTVHKLLEFDPKKYQFRRNSDNPIEADACILDEWSMGDTELTNHMMDAIPSKCHVVLIGDIDQLPSVGPGMVLRDLIDCGKIPVTRLDTIFRQAEGSLIVRNAHRIIKGESPIFLPKGEPADCFFMDVPRKLNEKRKSVEDIDYVRKMLVKLCQDSIPAKYNLDPIKDIQVLAPMKKGSGGVYELNVVLQQALNPDGEEIEFGKRKFRKGDRVMAFKNNYDLDTYNGDIGFVAGLVEVPVKDEGEETSEAVQDTLGDDFDAVPPKMEKFLKVMIDGREVFYPADHVDELQLAYCQTIHKSQGSEYPCVIVVLLNQHYTMLERNLIYTALTRAKKMGLFLASKSALGKAISRCQTKQRNSFLSSRIKLAAKEASLPCVGQVKTGIHLIA